jgi:type I site-specific restriction endonuclease
VDCVICLRPTKIRSLYCQIIGRGTRPYPGKDNRLLLDFLWLSQHHDLCRPAYLLAENEYQAKAATTAINEAGAPVDLEQMQELATVEEVHEREEALMKELDRLKKKRGTVTDPLDFAMSIHDKSLADYLPRGIADALPATLPQLTKLIQAGLDGTKINSAGQADAFLDALEGRKHLASPNTIKKLKQYGFQRVEEWPQAAAMKMIKRLAINHWRTPAGVSPATYRPGAKP